MVVGGKNNSARSAKKITTPKAGARRPSQERLPEILATYLLSISAASRRSFHVCLLPVRIYLNIESISSRDCCCLLWNIHRFAHASHVWLKGTLSMPHARTSVGLTWLRSSVLSLVRRNISANSKGPLKLLLQSKMQSLSSRHHQLSIGGMRAFLQQMWTIRSQKNRIFVNGCLITLTVTRWWLSLKALHYFMQRWLFQCDNIEART